jgi:hypothetical protein
MALDREQKKTFSPPICPYCDKPLTHANETVYESYVFNEETGTYDHNGPAEWSEVYCGKCGEQLRGDGDPLEDGPCNYQAE